MVRARQTKKLNHGEEMMQRTDFSRSSAWQIRRILLTAVLALTAVTTAGGFKDRDRDDRGDRDDRRFAIGLWGDLPYSDVQAQTGVPTLIADMNRHELAFTVHD